MENLATEPSACLDVRSTKYQGLANITGQKVIILDRIYQGLISTGRHNLQNL